MTTATELLLHAVLRKTAGLPAWLKPGPGMKAFGKDVALPGAAGTLSGGITAAAGGDPLQTAASVVGGAGLASKPMRHIFAGGTHGAALREMDTALKNPSVGTPRWRANSGELEARGTGFKMDPTKPTEVAGARSDLEQAASKTRWGGGSLGVLGKAGLVTAATVPRLASDVQKTTGNVAAATEGMKPGEENENNVRTESGGEITNIYPDPETGQQVVQYTKPDGTTGYHTSAPGMKLAPDLKIGAKLAPKQSVFWASGLGSNLTRAGGNIAGAAGAVEEGAKTLAGTTKKVDTIADKAVPLMTSASDIAQQVKDQETVKKLTAAASGVTDIGTGMKDIGTGMKDIGTGTKDLGTGVKDTGDTVKAVFGPEDPKAPGAAGAQPLKAKINTTLDSVKKTSDQAQAGMTGVQNFLKSDAAKYAGLGVAGLGLAYLVSKLFGKKSRD